MKIISTASETVQHFIFLSCLSVRLPEDKKEEDIVKVLSHSVTLSFTILGEKSFMQMMGNSQTSVSSNSSPL